MSVEIAGPPVPVQSPAFAGVTLRVPLSEEPSAAWLDVLVGQEKLPGKGHRVTGCAIDFHLGRGDRDVDKALRDIDSAIAQTNVQYAADAALLEQRAGGPAARAAAAIERVTPLCATWWAERVAAREAVAPEPRPLELNAASETAAQETPPAETPPAAAG